MRKRMREISNFFIRKCVYVCVQFSRVQVRLIYGVSDRSKATS